MKKVRIDPYSTKVFDFEVTGWDEHSYYVKYGDPPCYGRLPKEICTPLPFALATRILAENGGYIACDYTSGDTSVLLTGGSRGGLDTLGIRVDPIDLVKFAKEVVNYFEDLNEFTE